MPTIEEVEKKLTMLSERIDETLAGIHAGFVVLEQMKQQMEMMREKLNELKQMKKDAERLK